MTTLDIKIFFLKLVVMSLTGAALYQLNLVHESLFNFAIIVIVGTSVQHYILNLITRRQIQDMFNKMKGDGLE